MGLQGFEPRQGVPLMCPFHAGALKESVKGLIMKTTNLSVTLTIESEYGCARVALGQTVD
jgi:hypothetical protein